MLDLPPHIRTIHKLMDDYHSGDVEPYDCLRRQFDRPSIGATEAHLLATITALSAPLQDDPPPVYVDSDLEMATLYAMNTARQYACVMPVQALGFLRDIMHALPRHAELRCKAGHRVLRILDSLPRDTKTFRLSPLPTYTLRVEAALDVAQTLGDSHRGDYVIDLAQAHVVAHLDAFAAVDQPAAFALGHSLLAKITATDPLHGLLATRFTGDSPPAAGRPKAAGVPPVSPQPAT